MTDGVLSYRAAKTSKTCTGRKSFTNAEDNTKNVDNEVPGYRKEQDTVQINYKLRIV